MLPEEDMYSFVYYSFFWKGDSRQRFTPACPGTQFVDQDGIELRSPTVYTTECWD